VLLIEKKNCHANGSFPHKKKHKLYFETTLFGETPMRDFIIVIY